MEVPEAARLKAREDEKAKLKQLLARGHGLGDLDDTVAVRPLYHLG